MKLFWETIYAESFTYLFYFLHNFPIFPEKNQLLNTPLKIIEVGEFS